MKFKYLNSADNNFSIKRVSEAKDAGFLIL